MIYQKVAEKYKKSNKGDLQDFKESTSELTNFSQVFNEANKRFDKVGIGAESIVYEVGPDKILKLSEDKGNLR